MKENLKFIRQSPNLLYSIKHLCAFWTQNLFLYLALRFGPAYITFQNTFLIFGFEIITQLTRYVS